MITKKEAINLFGERSIDLAKALGKSKSAISLWPDVLDDDKTSIVIGNAVRRGIQIPNNLMEKVSI